MSAICLNITSSIYHHDWEAEMGHFSSIHQEIDTEIPPASRKELVCSLLAGIFLSVGGYLLPFPIGPVVGSSILVGNVFCCTKPISESEDREVLGCYRTSKVACLALSRYSQTRLLGPISTNNPE